MFTKESDVTGVTVINYMNTDDSADSSQFFRNYRNPIRAIRNPRRFQGNPRWARVGSCLATRLQGHSYS